MEAFLKGLAAVLTISAVTFVLALMRNAGKGKAAAAEDGTFVLRYPAMLAGLFFVGILIFGGLAAIGLKAPDMQERGRVVLLVVSGLFGGLNLIGIAEVLFVRVVFSEAFIQKNTWWRGPQQMLWEDVERLSFGWDQTFKLKSKQGSKLSYSMYLKGTDQLLELAQKKLPQSAWKEAVEKLDKLKANY